MWMVVSLVVTNSTAHSKIHQIILSETQNSFDQGIVSDARLRIIFKNFRKVGQGSYGLRLSPTGHKVLKKVFTHWEFSHNKLSNNKTLIDLDTSMTWPYYISRDTVVFYNELDAAMFKLNGGELSSITDII
jgi:hypothetical protein